MKFLMDAVVLQIENKRADLLTQGVDEDKIEEEISVALMADLQEKQMTESNAMNSVLEEKVSKVQIFLASIFSMQTFKTPYSLGAV